MSWKQRARELHARWAEERRPRRQAERTLAKLLRRDRRSQRGDADLELLVNLCQEMARQALMRAATLTAAPQRCPIRRAEEAG